MLNWFVVGLFFFDRMLLGLFYNVQIFIFKVVKTKKLKNILYVIFFPMWRCHCCKMLKDEGNRITQFNVPIRRYKNPCKITNL